MEDEGRKAFLNNSSRPKSTTMEGWSSGGVAAVQIVTNSVSWIDRLGRVVEAMDGTIVEENEKGEQIERGLTNGT